MLADKNILLSWLVSLLIISTKVVHNNKNDYKHSYIYTLHNIIADEIHIYYKGTWKMQAGSGMDKLEMGFSSFHNLFHTICLFGFNNYTLNGDKNNWNAFVITNLLTSNFTYIC